MTARALLLDYGGVLTPSVGRAFRDFEEAHDLPKGTIFGVVADAYAGGGDDGPIGQLELGRLDVPAFEQRLATDLAAQGHDVPADGLVARLHGRMQPDGRVWEVVRDLSGQVPLGLVSNSWGTGAYPMDVLWEVLDVVVLSADVGLRKPDPAIWHLACDRLGVAPGDCVFVDDLERNCEVARSLGMTAVHCDADTDRVLDEIGRGLGMVLG